MTAMIRTLQRDLSDHREVENELAKRSHFCQKVIQRYKAQIKQLQEDLEEQQRKNLGYSP